MAELARLIAENGAARAAAESDATLAAVLPALRAFQRARLAASYADLATTAPGRAAVGFFLDELYGDGAAAERDLELARAAPAFERALPQAALAALGDAIRLELLTQSLDVGLARALEPGLPITAARYAAAYRALGRRADRERQIGLALGIGAALGRGVRHAGLGLLLRTARRPARAAGLGALQAFLERGWAIFRALPDPAAFLETLRARETAILERLYAGADDPFEGAAPCLPSTT